MARKPTYPTLDVVAAIFAAREYQNERVTEINPEYDTSTMKPSQRLVVPRSVTRKPSESHIREIQGFSIPSLSDFAKATMGVDTTWLHEDTIALDVTDEHKDLAEKAIDLIVNKVMLIVLRGHKLNGFVGNLAKLLEQDEVCGRDFGLLSYTPGQAKQFEDNEEVDTKKTEFMDSKPIGVEGDSITATVSIFSKRELHGHDSIRYEGNDPNGNLILFYKGIYAKVQFEVDETYKLVGRIKAVGPTDYSYGAIVNTLYYVKVAK